MLAARSFRHRCEVGLGPVHMSPRSDGVSGVPQPGTAGGHWMSGLWPCGLCSCLGERTVGRAKGLAGLAGQTLCPVDGSPLWKVRASADSVSSVSGAVAGHPGSATGEAFSKSHVSAICISKMGRLP